MTYKIISTILAHIKRFSINFPPKNIMTLLPNPFCRILSCTLIMGLLLSCTSRQADLRQKYRESPVIAIQYWGEKWKTHLLWQRIAPAPTELVERICIENELSGFSERPVDVHPSREFFEALKIIASRLPGPVKRLAEERVIGIFTVNDLGSSGYTEAVRDEHGKETYAIIVLDKSVLLKRKANEWGTWKENSVFKPQAYENIVLRVKIETEENDSVVNAIRFVLLHELGHALGMASRVHPPWDDSKPAFPVKLPFPKLSWKMNNDGKIVSLFDDTFPERGSIRYYSFEKAPLSNNQILSTYKNLKNHSNFPSLQASASQWEDFAESFATYFHVVLEKRPWQVMIDASGQSPVIIDSCWNESRCAEKKIFMKNWFADP